MVGMLAIVAMGVNLRGAMLAGEPPGDAPFLLSYLAARAVVVALYLRASRYVALGRQLAQIHVAGGTIAAGGLLGSLLLPAPQRYVLWVATLLVEMLIPFVARRTIGALPISLDHIPERYGLFTMIVLGESVVSVTTGLGGVGWGFRSGLIAVACFALACGVWWLHFDFVGTAPLEHSFASRQLWVFGLLPIVVGLTAVGAGAQLAIEHADDSALAFLPLASLLAVALALAAVGASLPPLLLVGTLVGVFAVVVGLKVVRMAATDTTRTQAVRPRRVSAVPNPARTGQREATAR